MGLIHSTFRLRDQDTLYWLPTEQSAIRSFCLAVEASSSASKETADQRSWRRVGLWIRLMELIFSIWEATRRRFTQLARAELRTKVSTSVRWSNCHIQDTRWDTVCIPQFWPSVNPDATWTVWGLGPDDRDDGQCAGTWVNVGSADAGVVIGGAGGHICQTRTCEDERGWWPSEHAPRPPCWCGSSVLYDLGRGSQGRYRCEQGVNSVGLWSMSSRISRRRQASSLCECQDAKKKSWSQRSSSFLRMSRFKSMSRPCGHSGWSFNKPLRGCLNSPSLVRAKYYKHLHWEGIQHRMAHSIVEDVSKSASLRLELGQIFNGALSTWRWWRVSHGDRELIMWTLWNCSLLRWCLLMPLDLCWGWTPVRSLTLLPDGTSGRRNVIKSSATSRRSTSQAWWCPHRSAGPSRPWWPWTRARCNQRSSSDSYTKGAHVGFFSLESIDCQIDQATSSWGRGAHQLWHVCKRTRWRTRGWIQRNLLKLTQQLPRSPNHRKGWCNVSTLTLAIHPKIGSSELCVLPEPSLRFSTTCTTSTSAMTVDFDSDLASTEKPSSLALSPSTRWSALTFSTSNGEISM